MYLWFVLLFPVGCCFVTNHSKSQWLKTTNIYFFLVDVQVSCNSTKLGCILAFRFQALDSRLQFWFRSASCVSHPLWSHWLPRSCCTRGMNGRSTRGQMETHDAFWAIHCGTCMLSCIHYTGQHKSHSQTQHQ